MLQSGNWFYFMVEVYLVNHRGVDSDIIIFTNSFEEFASKSCRRL